MIHGYSTSPTVAVPVDALVICEVTEHFDLMVTMVQIIGRPNINYVCVVGDSCFEGELVPNWIIA